MKEINENELDALIGETLRREKILEEVNKQVMLTVQKQKRSKLFTKWAVFSFWIATLTILPIAGVFYIAESGLGTEVTLSFGFSILIFLITLFHQANKISAKFFLNNM
ncbi:MAG: hypothetical protein II530_02290 [Bacteroidaceae bacterium]|nr:hypothetical protein [Bacteroidaceae bacterium]